MTSPWTERHGGLWINRASTRNELFVEEYDSNRDSFTLIWKRAVDGHFEAEYLVKGKTGTDPQWSLLVAQFGERAESWKRSEVHSFYQFTKVPAWSPIESYFCAFESRTAWTPTHYSFLS